MFLLGIAEYNDLRTVVNGTLSLFLNIFDVSCLIISFPWSCNFVLERVILESPFQVDEKNVFTQTLASLGAQKIVVGSLGENISYGGSRFLK